MSAASRARAAAIKVCRPEFEDEEKPDADDIAGHMIKWDFERWVTGMIVEAGKYERDADEIYLAMPQEIKW